MLVAHYAAELTLCHAVLDSAPESGADATASVARDRQKAHEARYGVCARLLSADAAAFQRSTLHARQYGRSGRRAQGDEDPNFAVSSVQHDVTPPHHQDRDHHGSFGNTAYCLNISQHQMCYLSHDLKRGVVVGWPCPPAAFGRRFDES